MDEIKQETQGAEQKAEETKPKAEETKPKCKADKSDPDPEEVVEFYAPLDPTGKLRDLVLGVNGQLIRVKRGSTVKIKRKFVEVYQNSEAQTMAAVEAKEKAEKAAQGPIMSL